MVADHSLESVNALESDRLVFSNQVDRAIQEEDSILERIWLILVHDINEVAKEQTVSHFDELAIIIDDFVNKSLLFGLIDFPPVFWLCLRVLISHIVEH